MRADMIREPTAMAVLTIRSLAPLQVRPMFRWVMELPKDFYI